MIHLDPSLPQDIQVLLKACFHMVQKARPANHRYSVPSREFERVRTKLNQMVNNPWRCDQCSKFIVTEQAQGWCTHHGQNVFAWWDGCSERPIGSNVQANTAKPEGEATQSPEGEAANG